MRSVEYKNYAMWGFICREKAKQKSEPENKIILKMRIFNLETQINKFI